MMETYYTSRFSGVRWTILYGSYAGIERCAINQVQKLVQKYLPYVIKVLPASENSTIPADHLILIGTPGNNSQLKEVLTSAKLELDRNEQGYLLACLDSPWTKGSRVLLVTGTTSRGVLYAVQSLGKHLATTVITKFLTSPEGHPNLRKSFDDLPDFQLRDSPVVENRGIWTWGYVIRDYRCFFDNMVRLRMNMAIIWNDIPPVNAPQVIEYAHQHGISIIFGFQWGWGLPDYMLADPRDRLKIKEMVSDDHLGRCRRGSIFL